MGGLPHHADNLIAVFSAKLRTLLETGLPLREGTQNELELHSLDLSSEAQKLLFEYYDHTEWAQLGAAIMRVNGWLPKYWKKSWG